MQAPIFATLYERVYILPLPLSASFLSPWLWLQRKLVAPIKRSFRSFSLILVYRRIKQNGIYLRTKAFYPSLFRLSPSPQNEHHLRIKSFYMKADQKMNSSSDIQSWKGTDNEREKCQRENTHGLHQSRVYMNPVNCISQAYLFHIRKCNWVNWKSKSKIYLLLT